MDEIEDTEDTREKSKSQVKRELIALQQLGRELVGLSSGALQKIPLSDESREAIVHARQLRMGALARQLKHIGKLMRDEDSDAILEALAGLGQPHQQEVDLLHELVSWRDGLIAGEAGLFDQLCQRFPDLDRQHVHQLIRESKKEQTLNKPPKSARTLFRYLHELAKVEPEND